MKIGGKLIIMNSRFSKKTAGFALSFFMALSSAPLNVLAYESEDLLSREDIVSMFSDNPEGLREVFPNYLTSETAEAFVNLQRLSLYSGLIGFEDGYELTGGSEATGVIVVFEYNPAPTQVLEALVFGRSLSLGEATALVENSHSSFEAELSNLFNTHAAALNFGASYNINATFKHSLNGASVTVPNFMIPYLLTLPSVRAVYADHYVELPTPFPVALDSSGNPVGMAPGRERMRADELHDLGIRGSGTLVAILDTGIDYYHPSFAGSFITLEEMHARGATHITGADLLNVNGTYYYVGRDFLHLHPTAAQANLQRNPSPNNPMETSPRTHPNNPNAWSSHGTHVAGTVAGRSIVDAPTYYDILGIAPEALMVHYRVLGFPGGTPTAVITAGVNQMHYTRPDVVNMSLGGGSANAMDLQAININNIVLGNPYIVFVISAGNSGPNYFTGGNPGSSTMAITVGANIDGQTLGLEAKTPYGSVTRHAFLYGATRMGMNWLFNTEYQAYISTFPALNHREGYYTVFKMPLTPYSAAPGQVSGIGTGEVEDFEKLLYLHGAEALAGNFVLLNRGSSFVDIANMAYELNIGLISVNNPNQAMIYGSGQAGSNYVPFFMTYTVNGLYLRDEILKNGYAKLRFTRPFNVDFAMWPFSSRGPVNTSFEITPDIVANGVAVFSAVPWWTVGADADDYTRAFNATNGTSMSAPHVAGAAALMVQYSASAGNRWTAEEIKFRMQNTAILMDGGYGIFEVGAGQVDVYAAINASSLVYVIYDRVVTEPGVPFTAQTPVTTRVGSFSFGAINTALQSRYRTLEAVIVNTTDSTLTYNITYSFLTTGRNSRQGATLDFSSTTLTVAAGESASFDATLTLPFQGAAGHYEGYIYVHEGVNLVARLPFAAVGQFVAPPPPIFADDLVVYRPVISTGTNTHNVTSSELVIGFTPQVGFATQMFLMRDNGGITYYNWDTPEFEQYSVGFISTRFVPNVPNWDPQIGTSHRGIIFNGLYLEAPHSGFPEAGTSPSLLEAEGDFVVVMELFRQAGTGNSWSYDSTVLVPFSVDNAKPVFNSLSLNGIDLLEDEVTYVFDESYVLLAGNVFDEFINHAGDFDVWRVPSNYGPAVTVNSLALWVLVGENVEGNRPFRVELSPNGDFEIGFNIPEGVRTEVSLWLIDNYAPVPQLNFTLGVNPWNLFGNYRFLGESLYFSVDNLPVVDESLEQKLHHGVLYDLPGLAFASGWFVWSGLNVNSFSFGVELVQEEDGAYELRSLVAYAQLRVQSNYTPLSFARLTGALNDAINVLEDPSSTQTAINNAYTTLSLAINSLVLVPVTYFGPLNELILEAQSRVGANYTPLSFARLTQALNAAINVSNNSSSTQAQVDNAYNTLSLAINGLILR